VLAEETTLPAARSMVLHKLRNPDFVPTRHPTEATEPMDEIDRKLLELLQEDSTTPLSDLAEKVALSTTPVWKRIQKMEQTGVIARRVVLLDPELIGIGLIVFVGIEAYQHTPEWLTKFATAIRDMPEIMEAYRMAGEVDYMLRVAVPDMTEFDAFYKRLIDAVPLKNVTSRFSMEQLKHTTSYPLPNRAFRDRRATEPES
jgi:Lrp/AsnC family transcriptional regulator